MWGYSFLNFILKWDRENEEDHKKSLFEMFKRERGEFAKTIKSITFA